MKYMSVKIPVLSPLFSAMKIIETGTNIDVCRDPDDNKFIECAVDAKALYIVSDYRADALHEIQLESDLKRVLVYLFRIAEYENPANDMMRNNVYTENHLIRGDGFHRRNNVMERNANYLNVITYAKRLKPVYEGKTYVETVLCFFSFPESEVEKYRFIYEGKDTYAFPLSGKHIINGLYAKEAEQADKPG